MYVCMYVCVAERDKTRSNRPISSNINCLAAILVGLGDAFLVMKTWNKHFNRCHVAH